MPQTHSNDPLLEPKTIPICTIPTPIPINTHIRTNINIKININLNINIKISININIKINININTTTTHNTAECCSRTQNAHSMHTSRPSPTSDTRRDHSLIPTLSSTPLHHKIFAMPVLVPVPIPYFTHTTIFSDRYREICTGRYTAERKTFFAVTHTHSRIHYHTHTNPHPYSLLNPHHIFRFWGHSGRNGYQIKYTRVNVEVIWYWFTNYS